MGRKRGAKAEVEGHKKRKEGLLYIKLRPTALPGGS